MLTDDKNKSSLATPRVVDLSAGGYFFRDTVASRVLHFLVFLRLINNGSRKRTNSGMCRLYDISHIINSELFTIFSIL